MHESFQYTAGAALRPYVERAAGHLHSGLPVDIHVGMPSGSLTLVVPLDQRLTGDFVAVARSVIDSVTSSVEGQRRGAVPRLWVRCSKKMSVTL